MVKKRNGENKRSRFVSVKELAAEVGVSPRRIQQLVGQGVLLRKQRGKYDRNDCSRRYSDYIEELFHRDGYLRAAGPRSSSVESLNLEV